MRAIREFAIALSLVIPATAIADDLKLSCNGEGFSKHKGRFPYNFTASVDLESKKISIVFGGKVYEDGHRHWEEVGCTKLEWMNIVTTERFKATSYCPNIDIGYSWQINRTDESFYVTSSFQSAKGQCIKSSEKAF
tara:strand:- start:48 stop:455 length:408 start_codon:yes stop_codon:yes gene_type:complete